MTMEVERGQKGERDPPPLSQLQVRKLRLKESK